MRRLKLVSPIKITKILTDNGSQFTDRFTSRDSKPTGKHAFDVACANIAVEHRLAPPRRSQTNGMTDRFNVRISGLVKQTYFANAAELETTLQHWQGLRPELFVKRVYDQAGLDKGKVPQAARWCLTPINRCSRISVIL